MSEKREFPILNGKLLSDLDLNGHKLLGLNIPEGGGGSSVEVVAPSPEGAGKAADAKAVYEALEGKQDTLSDTQTAAVNSGITAEKVTKLEGIEAGAQKNPDLSEYAKTAEVLPRYSFVNANFKWVEEFTEATITIAPYTNAVKEMGNYPSATYTIEVADGDGVYCRDCVLRLEVPSGISAPNLIWGTNFHPRTDAETDFKCEVGVRNVYWITEYAPDEFTVAGWQETEGGNAV